MTRRFLSQCTEVYKLEDLNLMIPMGRSGRTAKTVGFTAIDAMHSASILQGKNEAGKTPIGFLQKKASEPEKRQEHRFVPPDYYAEQVLGQINEEVAIMFALEFPNGIPEPTAKMILPYYRKLMDTAHGAEIASVWETSPDSIELRLRHSTTQHLVNPSQIQELAIHVSAP